MGQTSLSELRAKINRDRVKRFQGLELALKQGVSLSFDRDEPITAPGKSGSGLFFIDSGIAAISSYNTGYAEIGHLPIHSCGFVSFGRDETNMPICSAFALTKMEGTFLSQRELDRFSKEFPEFNTSLHEIIFVQLTNLFNRFGVAASATVRSRLTDFLRDYIIHTRPLEGESIYPWGPSQQGLARLCCTSRSHVSVVLSGIRESGIAQIDNGRLIIPESSILHELSTA